MIFAYTMLGHAAANVIPVLASNRIGVEEFGSTAIRFLGASFISEHKGSEIPRSKLRGISFYKQHL